MKKKFNVVWLLIILIFIGIVVFLYFYVDDRLEMTDVYVAKYDLTNRTLITKDEIEEISVPAYYLNEQVLNNSDQIIGKYVKINSFVPKGSFFYETAIEDIRSAKDSIKADLKEGEVSYDININDIDINQAYLQKGMYVDVYLTIKKDKVVSDLFINNIKVLGLYDANNQEIKDYDKNSRLNTICFALPKDCVSYFNKAIAIGKLNAVIGENTYIDVDSKINMNSLVYEYLE